MKKSGLLIVISFLLILSGCNLSKDKTEIKVKFSDAEYVKFLSAGSPDSLYLAAYDYALKNYSPENGDFLTVFGNRFSEIDPEARLAAIFGTFQLMELINYESTNQQVIKVLDDQIKLAMGASVAVIKTRIQRICQPVTQLDRLFKKTIVTVKELPEKNTWLFTVNKKTDNDRLTKLLESHADFGIWESYEFSEIVQFFVQANNLLKDPSMAGLRINPDTTEFSRENPLFWVLRPSVDDKGEVFKGSTIGFTRLNDTALVNEYLSVSSVKSLFPRDLKLMWGKKFYNPDEQLFNLIAVKASSRDGLPLIDGSIITEAKVNAKKYPPSLSIRTNTEGAKMLSRLTSENIDRDLVFVMNNFVFSNARVAMEITGGAMDLTGDYTEEELNDFAALLGSGIIPKVGIKVISII